MVLSLVLGIFYLFTDAFYWLKWTLSYVALWLWKKTHPRRFDLYDYDTDDWPEKIGFLVPEEEKVLETPFPDEHLQKAADEICIYGVNSKSECLVLRISRACDGKAESWIYLTLADGRQYHLQETGYQRYYGGTCTNFSCGGLNMHYLSPMRRWRIVYCGMMREVDGSDNKPSFVKFNFVWTASSDVYDAPSDFRIPSTAEAMAKTRWKSFLPPTEKMTEAVNFYSQSGVIIGTVGVEDQPDAEMYLFGERMRYLGNYSSAVGSNFKHLLGVVPETGLILHVGSATIPDTCSNLLLGFIIHPNGNLKLIEDGVIITSSVKDSTKSLKSIFKAGKHYELAGRITSGNLGLDYEESRKTYFNLHKVEFEIEKFKGHGFIISSEIQDIPERKSAKIPLAFPSSKPLTVYFTDEMSQLHDVTGGKGSSLGKLTEISRRNTSFVVPQGIIVTTQAYAEFLTPEVLQKIDNLKNIVYGNTSGNVQDECKRVASAIENCYLPDTITKDIEEKLNCLFDGKINRHMFAVRSSATGEDTDQMSAAGQMDTYLGVEGLKKIYTAVKKCWASQFSPIAIEYKRQNGQILNTPMAVVIQEMVECEAAGVLFTCDPVTNNPSVVVITGNYGLGETVVSGSEEPDTIVLQKLENGEVGLKNVTIGLKAHKIVIRGDKASQEKSDSHSDIGETTVEDVPEDHRGKCCIPEDTALRLGKLSLQLEDYYKSPRDIEWGVRDNVIYILQSRPVTTGMAPTDFEIQHEFDGPMRCEKEFFTTCNIEEVLPGAVSPLGLDFLLKTLPAGMKKKVLVEMQNNDFMHNKYYPIGLMPFYNHQMMSVVDLVTYMGDAKSLEAQSMMVAVFGRILEDPEIWKMAEYKVDRESKSASVSQFSFYWNLFFSGRGIPDMSSKVFAYQFPIERCRTAAQTFDTLVHSISSSLWAFVLHMLCTQSSSVWNMYTMMILGKESGCFDTDVYSNFAKLLSTQSDVESADVPLAITILSEEIEKHLKSETFKTMQLEEAQEWLEKSPTSAGKKYRKFLQRHGHRSLKESDIYSRSWRMNPKSLIKLLQDTVGTPVSQSRKKAESVSEKISKISIPLSWKSRLLLRFVLPNCLRGVREREKCKSIFIKSVDNLRIGYEHLSKQLASEGYLPDSDLTYFLTHVELKEMLETRNPRLVSRAVLRRKMFPVLDKLSFEDISRGRPVPVNHENENDVKHEADLTMKGIPVSQGSVKAYARVTMSLEEAAGLQPGEVLISHSTDIGWSPYFPLLAGVVTEIGGLLSHGAVVSREYGIPCISGLRGATRHFRTGDYVLLDGNKGILQRLSTQ